MSALFTPLRVGDLELSNRIVIAPMCQYPRSTADGADVRGRLPGVRQRVPAPRRAA
jgi:2,4-dienoyl-CoA reductase-like NADH-dependent reductase (Old Yellow Enzyme family)